MINSDEDELSLFNDFKSLFKSLDMTLVIINLDLSIRKFTPTAQKLFGFTPSDIGKSLKKIESTFPDLNLKRPFSGFSKTDASFMVEVKNSRGVWYKVQTIPYKGKDNEIIGSILVFTNFDLVKRRTDKIKKSHIATMSLANKLPVSLIVIDRDGIIIMVNELFCEMFQLRKDTVEGASLYKVKGRVFLKESLELFIAKTYIENSKVLQMDISLELAKLGTRSFRVHGRNAENIGSNKDLCMLAFEDITDKNTVVKLLESSKEKYLNTLYLADNGILLVNEKGLIEFSNGKIEEIFGYSSEELKNMNSRKLILDSSTRVAEDAIAKYLLSPKRRKMNEDGRIYGCHKSGYKIIVDVTLEPFITEGRSLVACTIRDVSEIKRKEREIELRMEREQILREEAEAAIRIKNDFLATVSHELRTPLTTILSWAQMLRLGKIKPEKMNSIFDIIVNSSTLQKKIIDDLVETSRIRSGILMLNMSGLNPVDILESVVESVGPIANKKSIKIETRYYNNHKIIHADPVRLNQIFLNLLNNAIKFTPQGGKIEINVHEKSNINQKILVIEFKDSGVGISAEFIPNIFKRFTQESANEKFENNGLGLGLSIVKSLVLIHGGWVEADSLGLGKGATFSVSLPIKGNYLLSFSNKKLEESYLSLGTNQPLNLDNRHILIIDCDDADSSSLSIKLNCLGSTIKKIFVRDFNEKENSITRFCPDLLIFNLTCDVETKQVDLSHFGVTTKKLEEIEIPKLVITNSADEKNAEAIVLNLFDAHLSEHVDIATLSSVINTLIA